MSSFALSRFESVLNGLDVSVTRVDGGGGEFQSHLDEVVEPHAVGVALDKTFDDPELALSGTSVEADPTTVALRAARTGVTGASLGIAVYDSLVLSATDRASELVSLFVDRHVAVVRESDVERDMESAIRSIGSEFRQTRETSFSRRASNHVQGRRHPQTDADRRRGGGGERAGGRPRSQLEADDVRDRQAVASGTSCLEQIDALLERQPRHPIELLAERSLPTVFESPVATGPTKVRRAV